MTPVTLMLRTYIDINKSLMLIKQPQIQKKPIYKIGEYVRVVKP